MKTFKSSSGSKEGNCLECDKLIKGKKIKECNDCLEKFCKKHIKVDENTFSSICSKCFRNKIHLEISMEMGSQILHAKSYLKDLKAKLKFSKNELSSLKNFIDKVSALLLTNETSHQKKLCIIENEAEEKRKRLDTMISIVENLKGALYDCKFNEKSALEKFEISEREKSENQKELDILKDENSTLRNEIKSYSLKIKQYISYSTLRSLNCSSCKSKIKHIFREEIINGNQGSDSLIASVVAERDKRSTRKSTASNNSGRKSNLRRPED